jgi:cytochrome c
MDSFELNKIIGAILGTLLFVMGIGFLAEAIYEPAHGAGPGYALPEAVADTSADAGTAAPAAVVDIGTLLASADPVQGAAAAKKCASCHDFTKGGPNKTGPNLYGIVGEKIADVAGFTFSDALKAHASETWTYENLNTWLISPKAYAPGTKMTFAGDKDDADRANIIAYLSTLSDSPVPFPAPAAPVGGAAPTSAQTTDTSSAPVAASSEAPTPPMTTSSEAAPAAAASASSEAPAAAAPASSEAPAAAPASSEAPAAAPASSAEAPAAPASSAAAAPSAASSAAQ